MESFPLLEMLSKSLLYTKLIQMIRTLEQQFEPEDAAKLRIIQKAFESLKTGKRVSSYYIFEISRAIDAGMLLAALELSTTLLEIWLRDLLVIRKATKEKIKTNYEMTMFLAKYDRNIEGLERGASYHSIVKELEELEVIDSDEKNWLLKIYSEIRNPLHHGLSGRLLDSKSEVIDVPSDSARTPEEKLLDIILCPSPEDRYEKLESFLDYDSSTYLGEMLNFIAAHEIPK